MSNPCLYLIDVSGLCYRAYYAISGIATSYGQPTGAVFGFTNILNKILKASPEYLACCFDVSRQTFRQEKFAEYKIQRPAMPDELVSQMSLVREIVSAYNIAIFELVGYEADDLIASLTKKAKENELEVVIISSDKDMLQLVDEKVMVMDPKKDKGGLIFDKKQVELRYGLEPKRIVDMISLMGDTTDNIPGVAGIGEKTAVALLREFGDVSGLLKNISKVKSQSLRKSILDNEANIHLAYTLASLKDDIDIDFDLGKLKRKTPDYHKLFSWFRKLEFNSLLKGLPPDEGLRPPSSECLCWEENSRKEEILKELRDKKELFLVLDKEKGKIYFSSGSGGTYAARHSDQLISGILSDPAIKKVSHNLKEIKVFLLKDAIVINGLGFDTMLAAYLLDSSMADFSLAGLAFRYLEERYADTAAIVPEAMLDIIMRLRPILKDKLSENSLEKLFYELEMPLVDVLSDMQSNGVGIDTTALKSLSGKLEERLIGLRRDIYSLNSGQEFNLNSPKQLATVLFERLKLSVVKKTKTGQSTDEEVLRRLGKKHKLPLLILEYRQLAKLKNTYVDSLPELIDPKTRRVHATFDQVGTETGRLSSNNPNLQNIPVKSGIASLIREAFIAAKNRKIVSADYSQIELRVLAYFSKDKTLISAFNNDLDIHCHTASLIFGVSEDIVSDEMREIAKRINFGIIYGMSSFGLSKDLGFSPEEASGFIEAYFLRYPEVNSFIERQIKSARQAGYVTSLLGRRRFLPGINSSNNALKGFAERQAVNSTIQGSSADLIKLAMINIFQAFKQRGLKTMMIIQIHDELVFEVPDEEFKEALSLIKKEMESVFDLAVPIKVNIKSGQNWLDIQPVSI